MFVQFIEGDHVDLGCYADMGEEYDRVLPNVVLEAWTRNMTRQACIQECVTREYKYAGLQVMLHILRLNS